jgi:DNA-binding NarL/FixJ family response regulator
MGDKTKVLLVEDHPLVCQTMAALINSQKDLAVCGQAFSLQEALRAAARLKPDVAIVDLGLGQESGLQLIGLLQQQRPGLPILVVSMHEEDLLALPALRAGARGFVSKHRAATDLLEAIRQVLAGAIYLSPDMRRRFWANRWKPP